jgi:hypothetical protein
MVWLGYPAQLPRCVYTLKISSFYVAYLVHVYSAEICVFYMHVHTHADTHILICQRDRTDAIYLLKIMAERGPWGRVLRDAYSLYKAG